MIAPGPNNPCFRAARGLACAWVAALVLLLYPYTEDPAAPIKDLASAVFAIALTGVWAAGAATRRAPFRRLHAPFYALIAFLGIQMAAAAFSSAPLRSFDTLRPWCVFTLIAFVLYQCFLEPRHLRNLYRAIAFSVALSSLYGFSQYAGLDPFPWATRAVEEYRGLPATYGNPNLAGHALVPALILCAGLFCDAWIRRKRLWERIAYAVAGLLMGGHLWLSGMRGGVVALAFAGLFLGVFALLRWRGRGVARAGFSALAATVAVLACAAVAGIALAPSLPLDSSLQLRLHGYAGACRLFLDHWLLGIGPGNYAALNIAYWSDFEALWYALENKRNFHVHNEWLEIAVASGLPGLAAFSVLVLIAIGSAIATLAARHLRPTGLPGNPEPSKKTTWGATAWNPLHLAIPVVLVAMAVDACTGFNLHVPVSGAFFIVLLAQGPETARALPVLRGYRRVLPFTLVLLALFHGAATWRQFEAARQYQRAQGALAWERTQQAAGDRLAAARGENAARRALADAAERRPWDYKIPMLAGDLELEHGDYRTATVLYERALELSPHLPRLHIQIARAQLRLAGTAQGTARSIALEEAERRATIAQIRSPELAEGHAMAGWAAYLRAEPLPDIEAETGLRGAVEHFSTARRLGLARDTNLNAALGTAYARLGSWPEAAALFERCVMAQRGNESYWEAFHDAADSAGEEWPARYRQALLHWLGAGPERSTLPGTDFLAARLAETSGGPAAQAVTRAVLERTLREQPERLARWGAWLGTHNPRNQLDALRTMTDSIQASGSTGIPDAITALAMASSSLDLDRLAKACAAIARFLATAPGGERHGPMARVYKPLLTLLEEALDKARKPPAFLAGTQADLGAASLETGALRKAEALLSNAARHLPAGARGHALYYRSRTLLALGQPEAALAVAQDAAAVEQAPVEYRWQLARCLAATGKRDAARFLYESLTQALPPDHLYQALLAGARDALSAHAPEGAP